MKFSFSARSVFRRMRRRFDPTRDWMDLLAFSAVILIGIIFWNVWAFDTVVNGGIIGVSATSTAPILSQTAIESIQATFANRAAEEAKYVSGEYQFTDPSQ